MKKIILFIGIIAAFLFLGCDRDLIDADIVAEKQHNSKSKLQNKVVISDGLTENVIGNTKVRKMQIYTPPGYHQNGEKRYPVVYLLHGLPFSEKSYIDMTTWDSWIGGTSPFQEYPDFPSEGFREWVDGLIESGNIEPMIIVMPNAANEMYGFSFYTNSILNGNFEDFIVEDLVNYVDSKYRTITSSGGRAVIGNSQGGYAAIKFGLLHPDKFGVVASHSGLLYLDGVLSMGEAVMAENPDGFMGPDPDKFLTSAGYAMSSAWSPNLSNPPFLVDLPFEYPSGAVIPEVREKWLAHDVFTMLDQYHNNFRSLNGIYMDAGEYDQLGVNLMMGAFSMKLDGFGIPHTSEEFEGSHFNKIFSRLEISLAFCSDHMSP